MFEQCWIVLKVKSEPPAGLGTIPTGENEAEKLSDLFKVMQELRARIWTEAWLQVWSFFFP